MLALAAEDRNVRPPAMPSKLGRGKPQAEEANPQPDGVNVLLRRSRRPEKGIYMRRGRCRERMAMDPGVLEFPFAVLVSALRSLGLPIVTPHSARHCFISTLQAQGIEVGLVAKLAGHASAVVTLGHHTQAVRGAESAIAALERAFTA